ncbi:hypothetical protein HPULCUR_011823 [Helicostylum pulchrum]|uniref:Uncharacterized protein n=1 Tax=Helicostylum pulchrum TaxID=562976 RepID=A0ABP9YH57_9FUNG
MNLNIEKIKEEDGLFQGYDSNSDSSLVAPWEYSSRSLHLGQEANPNITHMKKKQQQQQKQHGDVTRRLPGDKKFQSDCTADNVNVSSSSSTNKNNEAVALSAPPPFIAGIKPSKAGGGDDYERDFCFDTRLSPSSSIMYHHHPHNISPSPSSSKMMLMMDNEYYDIASNNLVARESILMKKALKSKAKKRRESIAEPIVTTTRKRTVSTSIVPRLTKSSVISSQQQQQQQNLHKRNNSTTTTTTLNHKRRYYSLQQPLSQKDRNNLAAITNDKEDIYLQQQDATAGVHWDPHIDAFEILRAKITGITRSMQEFHVQELFQDEKRKKKKLTSTTSSPLITTASRNNISNRRFSLASSNSFSTFRDDPTTNNNRLSFISHRRIRSQSCVPLTSPHDDDLNEKKEYNTHYEQEEESEEEDYYNDDMMNIPSPNLTALYLTTNNLIHSRLDELSETASLKSTHDDINEVSSMLVWQKKFLNLVTSCIHQSEQLESLSTDVLNTEHRVRELMLINETIHDQFHEREKQYEERIRECQDVAQQQLMMIDSLEELTADINMKTESRRREIHRQEALLALDANCYKNRDENSDLLLDEENNNNRWSFQKSVGDLLNMDDKHDLIQKMRWDIGMFVGGGVGTGHVIHSYEDKLNGIDMMIAGTGTTSTTIQRPYYPVDDDEYNTDDDYTSQTEVSKHRRKK